MSFDLFDITAKRAELTPNAPAMEELLSGKRLSYAELDERASRAAQIMVDHGIKKGDRVAVLCRNRIAFFELLFACGKLGAIMVPLNWRMPALELQPLIEDADPRLLFYGAEDAATAKTLSHPSLQKIGLDEDYDPLISITHPHPGRLKWPGEDCWYLLYTSGTTGTPKAVIQTYAMALANYVNIGQAIALRPGDVTLNFLPLFHTAGINLHTLPTLMIGGEVLVLPGFDADQMMDLLTQNRLDIFFGVPAVYQQISLHPNFEKVDLSRVRSWACGGAPLPDVLVDIYKKRDIRVCGGFGMTETGPTAFLVDPDNAWNRIGSVGKAQFLTRFRLVDGEGNDVPQGETGEILLAGSGITPGYWNRPSATAQAFTHDGWLKSGDLGRVDEDGYLYIVGRIKDMFISGGENIYPAEIENLLAHHPAIMEAAVLGVPDERWGEVGRAYIMLKPGEMPPSQDALQQYCRGHLAAFKVPKSFVIVDDFPRTAAGKIQKHLIPQMEHAT